MPDKTHENHRRACCQKAQMRSEVSSHQQLLFEFFLCPTAASNFFKWFADYCREKGWQEPDYDPSFARNLYLVAEQRAKFFG